MLDNMNPLVVVVVVVVVVLLFYVRGRGVARPNIMLKQAFLRYIIEYVHLQARSFEHGIDLPPSTMLTRGNNFCKFLIAFLKKAYS